MRQKVKRKKFIKKIEKMKKIILGVATLSLISATHFSCKKETISNPMSQVKMGENGLDRIPMIEINKSLDELMRNDEDADEQKLNYQLFELAEATKGLIQRIDFKQLVLTLAMESKLGTVYYSEILEHSPELYSMINNVLAEKDLSIESITENMTHRPLNPNPEFPETAELERYEPAIYVPNFQIANIEATALISPNIEIEIEDEDYIVAWFYKADGSIGQTVINEETALTTTNPIFILNHNVLKSVHDEFVEFAKVSGDRPMTTRSNAMNLVCDKLKIKAGYRHEQGSNRSEFCINAVVVPLSGSPYYSYYTTSNNNDNSLRVKKVTKSQVNSSAWVTINNFWHHDDVKPSADNKVYWNSFERDWNRGPQSLGGGVTFNKVWVMAGRMRYVNDWYTFQPNTVSVSHDIKFWWFDSGTPVVFDNWKSSYSLKKEN